MHTHTCTDREADRETGRQGDRNSAHALAGDPSPSVTSHGKKHRNTFTPTPHDICVHVCVHPATNPPPTTHTHTHTHTHTPSALGELGRRILLEELLVDEGEVKVAAAGLDSLVVDL